MKRLANIKNNDIHVVRGISEEEESKLLNNFEILSSFNHLNDKFLNVHYIFQKLNKSLLNENQENNLARLIAELMSTFRAFIDHSETYLKTTFGKNSPEFSDYKIAQSKEYDNVFGYRFIYELRNYIQHYELPKIIMSGRLLDNGEKQFCLYIKKDSLKTAFNWKTSIRSEINQLPDKFDLLILINHLMESLLHLNYKLINLNLNIEDLLIASKEVLFYKSFQQNDSRLCLIEYLEWYKPGMPKRLSLHEFPFETADHLINNINISRANYDNNN